MKNKTVSLLLTIVCVVFGLCVGQLQNVGAQYNQYPVVSYGKNKVVGGVVMVMFVSAHTFKEAQSILPAGFVPVEQLVDPQTTMLYHHGSFLSSDSWHDLKSAEDKLTRSFVVQYSSPFHPYQAALLLRKIQGIEFTEPWYVAETNAAPNDPFWMQQPGLRTMKMAEAWSVTEGNPNVVIAISDNGVTQTHEDIAGSLFVNTGEIPNNAIDDDHNGFVDDYKGVNFTSQQDGTDPGNTYNPSNGGHGTNVAGIAGATTNNNKGIAGVGNKCRIFPMKTAPLNSGSIVYGYQSLLYAAQRGYQVVNCSWGIQKPFSPIDQAVIDYCLAHNMVVVSSAGNHGNYPAADGWSIFNFPAAYDGVIGTGEATSDDVVVRSSGLGKNAMVIAPSNGTMTVSAAGGYTNAGIAGTSFSSPMAAGVVGLICSKYPLLKPRQVAALLRRTTDDISSQNPGLSRILCGRINALNAVSTDPMSISALRISSVTRTFTNGVIAERFTEGDTLDITYQLTNDLGPSSNVMCTLATVEDNGWSVTIVSNSNPSADLNTGATTLVGKFRIVVNSIASLPLIMKLKFDGDNYDDYALDYLMPPSPMTVMQNNELVYSVGDDLTFGYSSSLTTRQGVGFAWKAGYNLISPSGFILCENGTRVLKAFDNVNNRSEFSSIKPYTEPQRNLGIMSDDGATAARKIGLRVEQYCSFPSATSKATVLSITLENTSGTTLTNLSAGHLFDWDIGYAGLDNGTRLAPDAIPTTVRYLGDAQAFERPGVNCVVVCAAVSSEIEFRAQLAGMMLNDMVNDPDGISDGDVVNMLTSNTNIQTDQRGDACGSIGMLFPGAMQHGDKRSFNIIIGVGANYAEATQVVRETILNPLSVDEELPIHWNAFPLPANETFSVSNISGVSVIQVVDAAGNVVLTQMVDIEANTTTIDVSDLSSGMYYCRLVRGHSTSKAFPLVVLH